MTNRKNIKVSEDTFKKLERAKGKYETWDGFFQRLTEELGAEND